jgi:uncharacterized protein YprB with RNaseH-like and TPR domain
LYPEIKPVPIWQCKNSYAGATRSNAVIERTFIIFPGIGSRKERNLWSKGILDWDDLSAVSRYCRLLPFIEEAKRRLSSSDASYFSSLLRNAERWRLLEDFMDLAAFIDIEVENDGNRLKPVVAGILRNRLFTQLYGENLSRREMRRAIDGAAMIVTFNGSAHDLRIIRDMLGNDIPPSVDLRAIAMKLGVREGLKQIEYQRGIKRKWDVVLSAMGHTSHLWHLYRKGNRRALDLLLEYNREDTINMYPLAVQLNEEMKRRYAVE